MRRHPDNAHAATKGTPCTWGGCVVLLLLVAMTTASAQETKGDVLFDQAHGQLFSPIKDGGLDYSAFAGMFNNAGHATRITQMRVNAPMLHATAALVVSGPFQEFTPAEISAVSEWVSQGGKLIVLLHISQSVARLTEVFGITVSNVPVHERAEDKLIDHASTDFTVTPSEKHEILQGVGAIDFYGSFALLPEGKNVRTLAMTSAESFADINGSNAFDEGDVAQPFCVMAVATWGKGGVLVLGDDAMLSNTFIGKADNGLLAANIVRWAGSMNRVGTEERSNAW